MKKFGKLLAVLFAAVILLGGCAMKAEYNIKIKDDKNVTMGIVMAYDKEMLDSLISMGDSTVQKADITDDMRWAYLDKEVKEDSSLEGATVTKYEQDGFYGYVFSKDVGLIDDLSTEDKDAKRVDVNKGDLDSEKIFIKDGDKYKSNMFIDKKSDDFSSINSYKSYVDFQIFLIVDLPNKAISNNATEVTNDGKTLKWNLIEAENVDFEFEFAKKNPIANLGKDSKTSVIIIIIAIVVVVVIIIVALIVVIIAIVVAAKKKKASTQQNQQ